jgi:hypothetical protein
MDKVIEVVLKQVRDKKAQLNEAVGAGAAKDYADYKGLCGEIRGLSAVEMYLNDLAHNLESNDD